MNLRLEGLLWLATFVANGFAISLIQVIQSRPELSILNTYINNSTNITNFLSNANNFTFLAPNNNAVGSFLSNNPNVLTAGLLDATFQYSLLRGGYPKLSFTNTSQFPVSNLVNSTYSNVTAGQAVELVLDGNGSPQVVSGNKSIGTPSTTDIICTGGIIHVMNEVLSVPIQAVSEFTAAGLEYFVSILNSAGYLNMDNAGYVNEVLELTDITYFIPNSAAALSNATTLAANLSADELKTVFEYHIIPGFVGYSTLLKDGMSLKTAQGSNVTITIQDGDMYVNSAKVIASDYIVANGVVHVIDNLLDRNDTSPPPKPKDSTAATSSSATTSPSTSTPTASAGTNVAITSSSKSKILSTGATAGIAAGASIGGLILLAGLVVWLLRRNKKLNKRDSGVWSEQSMQSNNDRATFRARPQRPRIQTQEDDLGSTPYDGGKRGSESRHVESKGPAPYIPMRSPDRVVPGNEFF